MNIERLRDYCLTKPGVTESFPFGDTTLVFKVGGKVFLLADTEQQPLTIAVKCDPEKAVELRDQYDAVQPGYHLNKKHWNSITTGSGLRDTDVYAWIDHSYDLVYSGLPKMIRVQLN